MTKSRWPKLGLKHDQNFFWMRNLYNWTWPKFTTPTNINFTPKNMLVRSPAHKLALAGDTCPASLCSSTRKKHQAWRLFHEVIEWYIFTVHTSYYSVKTNSVLVRRTPDIRLRFVSFNFGHVLLFRSVIVMVRSYSFGHLESVRWVFLICTVNLIFSGEHFLIAREPLWYPEQWLWTTVFKS